MDPFDALSKTEVMWRAMGLGMIAGMLVVPPIQWLGAWVGRTLALIFH
jgi:hypothetical protein